VARLPVPTDETGADPPVVTTGQSAPSLLLVVFSGVLTSGLKNFSFVVLPGRSTTRRKQIWNK
jgi:hypothetical protein